ncbi:12944_t:CDS:1, partial [Dentiscutata erythropus]
YDKAVKDYHLLAIANIVQNEAKKAYKNSIVEYLKTQEVANIKFKLAGSINVYLIGESNLKADINNTMKFLTKKNYYVKQFFVK